MIQDQSESGSSQFSDIESLDDYEQKLKKLKIQDIQMPHSQCSDVCNIFKTISKIEKEQAWDLKKVPHSKPTIQEALKLLNNRLGIRQKQKKNKKHNHKPILTVIQQEGLQYLYQSAEYLKNNNYPIKTICILLQQPEKVIKYILSLKENPNNLQMNYQATEQHINWIKNFIESRQNFIELSSMVQIYNEFKQFFQSDTVHLSLYQFRKLVKTHLNINHKKPILQNANYDKNLSYFEQHDYILKLMSLKQKYINIIYVDETIINRNLKQRHYWYFAGRNISQKSFKIQKNISVLGALGDSEFFCFQLQQGNNNAISFGIFLHRLIMQAKKKYKHQHFAIVLDNSRIHQSRYIKEIYLSQITHLFLPKYCPQFNPIELFWHMLKVEISKNVLNQNQNLSQVIHQCIHSISKMKTQKYIDHTLRIVMDILLKK